MANEPLAENPNPYAAPATDVSGGGAEPALEITREEIDAFVGERSGYYWGHWKDDLARPALLAGFNWAGLILNVWWLAYRKLWREVLGVFALIFVAGAAMGLVGGDDRTLGRVVSIGTAAVVGALGNGLYLRRARRVIASVRALEPDPERRLALLRERGGVSWPWVIVVGIFIVGLRAIR